MRFVQLIPAAALLALVATGCSVSQPFPQKSSYALQVPPPPSGRAGPATRSAAIVGGVNISRPYNGQGFVYRVGAAQFDTDYYNGFVAAPDRLLAGDLSAWLAAANIFAAVGESGWTSNYRFIIRAHVLQLYGDYRDKGAPKAVIAVKLYLIDDLDVGEHVVLQKVYSEEEPLARNEVGELVAAWERAWQRALAQMIKDIRVAVSGSPLAAQ